jgi:hypothetical protein
LFCFVLFCFVLFCLDTTVTSAEVLSTSAPVREIFYGIILCNLSTSTWTPGFALHISLSGVNRICAFSLVSIYLSYEVAVAKIAGKLGIASPSTRSATV